ncbi:unnamed protein product [Symbiodinium necroappetens]|uniref:Protein kinase domain-containing protein n=1 Tax=Symbiodinium necroappetens TaxID=1628268 RepID=A0A813BM49_9DINO|nr:unnamed protein product [Symbiodinium necroappetens]
MASRLLECCLYCLPEADPRLPEPDEVVVVQRSQSKGRPADLRLPKPDQVVVEDTAQELNVERAFAWGTFGTAHRVDGKVNGEDAVVKLPRVHRLSFHVNDALLLNEVDDVKLVRRREAILQEEAKVLQFLCDCRGVVPWLCNVRAWVGGVQVTGMALQKMDCTLRELWMGSNSSQCSRVRLTGILRSAVDIFWALGRMWECGFCHMDIKPENLLWSEDHCQLYLADFGSAARRPGFKWKALDGLRETANIRESYALAFRGVWWVLPQLYKQFHSCSYVRFNLRDVTPSDMEVKLPLADPRLDYFALVIILRNLLGETGGIHDGDYPEGSGWDAKTIPKSFYPPKPEKPWGQADPTWPSLLEARGQLRALVAGLEALALQPEHELKQKGDSFLDDALRTCLHDWQPAESRERLRRLQKLDIMRGTHGPGPSGPLVFRQRDSSGTAAFIMSFDLGKLGDKPQLLVHEAKKELAARLGCCPPQIKLWALLRPRFENLEEEEEVLPGMCPEQLDSPSLRVEVMPLEQLEKEIDFEVSEHLMKTSYEEVWYLLNSRHVHPDCISLRDCIDAGPGPCRAALENKADPNQISDCRDRDPNRAGYKGDGRGTTPLTYATRKTPIAYYTCGHHRHQNAKAMEMMTLLLEAGAEVNRADDIGETPMSLIQWKLEKWRKTPQMRDTFCETRSLLLEAGAIPTLRTVSV